MHPTQTKRPYPSCDWLIRGKNVFDGHGAAVTRIKKGFVTRPPAISVILAFVATRFQPNDRVLFHL